MTASLARERRGGAAWAIALAIALGIVAWLVLGWDAAKLRPPPAIGLVAPDFAARPEAAQAIVVVTREGSYRISRLPKGWSMTDRGAYPIKAERMRQFTQGLAALAATRPLTRDRKKHPRLGVDDPSQGGAGVRLQVQDAQGALLANLVLSSFPDRLYLRRNADPQVWAGSAMLPNLRQASAWLDLTPFALPTARIARVDVAAAIGPGYALVRPEPDAAAFQIARPLTGKPLAGKATPSQVAGALGALNPIDVAPAPAIAGPPNARVVLQTAAGLVIEAEAYVRGALYWVKLGARAVQPAAEPEAQALNARIGPWAYGLTALDYALQAPPLAEAAMAAEDAQRLAAAATPAAPPRPALVVAPLATAPAPPAKPLLAPAPAPAKPRPPAAPRPPGSVAPDKPAPAAPAP